MNEYINSYCSPWHTDGNYINHMEERIVKVPSKLKNKKTNNRKPHTTCNY